MSKRTKVALSASSLAKLAAAKAVRQNKRASVRGERAVEKKIMRQDEQLVKPGNKRAPGTRVNKYARQSAAPPGDFKTDTAITDAYALTLMNPMANVGAKLPDQWANPSSTKHLEYEITTTLVQDGAGYWYTGFTATDALASGYSTISSVSGGNFSWGGYAADPQYTVLSSYMDRYRLVSMMIRLENGTNAANLQGRAYSVQTTTSPSTTMVPGKIADLTASGTRVRSFQLNDVNVTPCARYIPYANNATTASQTSGNTPSEWQIMGDTSPTSSISIVVQVAANTGADFVWRIYKNWEFIPLLGAQYVIPTSVEIAMPQDSVTARRRLLKHEETWEGDLESAVRDTAALARNVARTAGSLGRVASNIWGGLTAAWSGVTARRQALQAAHGMLCQITDDTPEVLELRRSLHKALLSARQKELASFRRSPLEWQEEKEPDSPVSLVSVRTSRPR